MKIKRFFLKLFGNKKLLLRIFVFGIIGIMALCNVIEKYNDNKKLTSIVFYDAVAYSKASDSGLSNSSGDTVLPSLNNESANSESAPRYDIDAKTKNPGSDRININTADSEELQKLSGIGPSKAQSIIDYRNSYGLFVSIEEITEVSGIGEKTFEKIKDKICIN